MATNLNKPVVRGDAWECTITLTASDGSVVDLSGYTIDAAAVIASRRDRFTLTVERSDALGVITVKAARAVTAEWVDPYVVFDVRYSSPNGTDYRTPKFNVPVNEGVVQ